MNSNTCIKKITLPNDILLETAWSILKEGKTFRFSAKGNSMLPFINNETDSIELKAFDKVEKYDIVLAKIKSGSFVLHRVIGVDGNEVTLMGDGNLAGHESCTGENVLGTVTTIIKPGGKKIDCSGRCFKAASRLWIMLLPIRRYLLKIYRILK